MKKKTLGKIATIAKNTAKNSTKACGSIMGCYTPKAPKSIINNANK